MAKGLEDTVFYIYNRLAALNEVGGEPQQFGIGLDAFHERNLDRQRNWPSTLLATSTHDTKRSEDVRARLDVLSEMPKQWAAQIFRWRRTNRTRKRMLADGRTVPDLNEEYFLYQTLAGSWPQDFASEAGRQRYVERIQQYMYKAVHEAKMNLSWINDDPVYLEALRDFVEKVLAPGTRNQPNAFLDQIQTFVPVIGFFGAINSLAQRLLMITSPGGPDLYQGSELWDLSLVDPDNRRPVDYSLRQRLLTELDRRAEAGNLRQLCEELMKSYQDGRIKLWTTIQALRCRRDRRELFHSGQYSPVFASGLRRDNVIAFAREHNNQIAITAVPRLSYGLADGEMRFPLRDMWETTELPVPARAAEFMENAFTGEKVKVTPRRTLLCREVFAHFPVALLVSG
jgi:(1->4)-alpha-D-glucan 1-alpha-D-glucosylmutase